ncbi:MAG: Tryptophan synthase alpha chain [Labilithrix sp.]|nr:Tryptophan synthase alpha chain [Labilithrix sp.]
MSVLKNLLLHSRPRLHVPLGALAAVALVVAACSSNDIDMGAVRSDDAGLSFTPPDGASDAAPPGVSDELACKGTTCPAPWATCTPADGPTYKCGIDLTRNHDHCGSCDNACPTYAPLHMASRCLDSACVLECANPPADFGKTDFRNCNALVDDGCETDVYADPSSCGACGNACAAGLRCIEGKCGCPAGLLDCDGECIDPQTSDNHCGACGTVCTDPPVASTCGDLFAKRIKWGCNKGTCGHIQCRDNAADCNGDVGAAKCGDGCEVEDLGSDRNNCGACGTHCVGAEQCIDEGSGPTCAIPCKKFGTTACSDGCRDLLVDPANCGSCGAACPRPGPNQAALCSRGVCESACAPGFADCNGSPADGCEVDLRIHPANCGACGNACDIAGGQPCIEGKCLLVACEAGVTR